MMSEQAPQSVLDELVCILRSFPRREYFGEIDRHTRFFDDLEMVSIDAVVLGEKLEQRYGFKFPFNELIAALRDRQAEDLVVGELADFIHFHLSRRIVGG
jgi:acyl carrier protein